MYILSFVAACTRNGIQYQVNEEILVDCDSRCVCQANGTFTCVPQMCPPIDGPMCSATGDPHYVTWDRRQFVFHGTCEYSLVQFCNSTDFVVSGDNNHCLNRRDVACVQGVRITFQNTNPSEIFIDQRSLLFLNGVQQTAGDQIYPTDADISVRRTGGRIHVTLPQHGVYIYFDGVYTFRAQVSSKFFGTNKLCGHCGNYNGNPLDDPISIPPLQCPGGRGRRNAPSDIAECDNSSSTVSAARERCGVMRTSSVFNICNSAVDPARFISDCEYDYCCGDVGEREGYICDALSNYAAECALNGAQPSNWRGEFCCKFKYRHLLCVI